MTPSSATGSLFNTLPPAPVDPATTVRAPSLSKGAGPDRDALLSRLRVRRAELTPAQIAALFKILE